MSGSVVNLCHDELGVAERLLDDLEAAGVAVVAVDGRLRLSPASAVGVALRARVAACKPAILNLLASRRAAVVEDYRKLVERVAESCRLPPDVAATAQRGDRETSEEALLRQAAAIERLRLDREAFVEKARQAGVYRGLASDTGAGLG